MVERENKGRKSNYLQILVTAGDILRKEGQDEELVKKCEEMLLGIDIKPDFVRRLKDQDWERISWHNRIEQDKRRIKQMRK